MTREPTLAERNGNAFSENMRDCLIIHASLAALPALVAAGNSPETAAKLALDYGWDFLAEVDKRGLTVDFPTTGVVALDYTTRFGAPKV